MSGDGAMPHQFPKGAPDEVLAWRCEACGEWISEMSREPRTECSIDWRAVSTPEDATP